MAISSSKKNTTSLITIYTIIIVTYSIIGFLHVLLGYGTLAHYIIGQITSCLALCLVSTILRHNKANQKDFAEYILILAWLIADSDLAPKFREEIPDYRALFAQAIKIMAITQCIFAVIRKNILLERVDVNALSFNDPKIRELLNQMDSLQKDVKKNEEKIEESIKVVEKNQVGIDAAISQTDTTKQEIEAAHSKMKDIKTQIEAIKKPYLSAVIESMQQRIKEKKGYSTIMLGVIFFTVVVGSFLSVGSASLDEYQTISTTKRTLTDLKTKINNAIYQTASNAQNGDPNYIVLAEELKKINKNFDDNFLNPIYAGKISAYIDKTKADDVHWNKILMRISLAVLTVFLVQIFFNVYKYYQIQTSFLENKFEMLQIYQDTENEEERMKLRETLLKNTGSSPPFGKDPSSPIDHILKMADKVAEKTNSQKI